MYIYSYENAQKLLPTELLCSFWLRYAPNRLSAGALPQTPLGELTALPDPLAGLRGGAPGKGKEVEDESGGEGRGRKGRGG